MTACTIRRSLLAVALVAGLAGLGGLATGCVVHSHDDDVVWWSDVAFDVHNLHGDEIWIEGVDDVGQVVNLGFVRSGDVDQFILDDFWEGRTLRARCTCDGGVIEARFLIDGMHWDVF